MIEFVLLWLVLLTGTDLAQRRLPNRLTMPALLAGLGSGCADVHVAAAMAVAAVPYLAAVMVGGCGGGDLKLAVALGGMIVEPVRTAVVIVVAALLTGVAVTGAAVVRRDRSGVRGQSVAHGPALIVSALMVGGVVS